MNTAERLDQIEQWLQANRPDYQSMLEPPAADDALRSAEEKLVLNFQATLKPFTDGTTAKSHASLLHCFTI